MIGKALAHLITALYNIEYINIYLLWVLSLEISSQFWYDLQIIKEEQVMHLYKRNIIC